MAITKESPEEDIIERSIGSFGRWHFFMVIIIYLVKFSIAWHQLGIVFLAPPIDFNCSDNRFDACSADCPSYVYDKSVFDETIITEWDLVCDRAQLANVSQLTFMFGILLGNVIFGWLSDRFGRRNPLVWAVMVQVGSGVAAAFAPWFWLFITLRFLCACATGGTMLTSFVILMEIVGKRHRTVVGVLFQIPFILGHASLGLFGYLLRDWHNFQMAISIPSALLVVYYWIVPESPRWLLITGRPEYAISVMEKAAMHNRLPTYNIKENVEKHCQSVPKPQGKGGNVIDLVRTPEMRIRTLCVFVNWIVIGLSYFGVAQYLSQLAGSIFVNVAIAGFIQIPGVLACMYIMGKFGRKWTLVIGNMICGICCLLITVTPANPTWPTFVLGSIGMMGIAISFDVVYVYTGELYPTMVRNVGLGTASMFARFGSMTAPFVTSLSDDEVWLPPLIFGVAPLLATIFCFRLPETLNQKLPDTIEEAERVGVKSVLIDKKSASAEAI